MIKAIIMIVYFISLYFILFWLLVFLEKGAKERKLKGLTKPSVSVVIPAYNEENNIKETMLSVLNLDYDKDKVELIVVDDGSTDKTAEKIGEIIKKFSDRDIKFFQQKNKGKASAMNHGLRYARGELLISLDADSIVEKKALKRLVPYFDNSKVAAVLPLIKVQYKRTLMQKIQHCEYLINFFYKRLMSHLNCVHVTPGPFSVYRKNVIKKLGGFDENNLTEDLEMAFRLQKNHYKIVQLLSTCVKTKAPATFPQFYKQRNRWYKGSLINLFDHKYRGMMFNREYGDLGFFQLPMIIISATLSLTVIFLIFGVYILKPIILGLRNFSYINFNFLPFVKDFFVNFNILNLNFIPLFYGTTLIILALVFISRSHHYTKESLIKNLRMILSYLIIYPFMISIVWLGIIFDFAFRRIQKW